MENSSSNSYFPHFPKDDYALSVLTQAAMQQGQNTSNGGGGATGATTTGTKTKISNSNLETENSQTASDQEQSGSFGEGNMDLVFNTATTTLGRQNPYMSAGYHGLGAGIGAGYADSMGILSAERYDDGRGGLREVETMELRTRQAVDRHAMPFGMVDMPRVEEAEDGGRRRKKARVESADEEEEARKKARGRPRVDTKDETAADVSC